jgi:general secretion pathway protein C
MNRLLTRHFGLFKFGAVGLVVFFAGSALTTHFSSKLLLDVAGVAEAAGPDEPDPEGEDDDDDDDPETRVSMAKASAAARANDSALASMATKATRKQETADSIVTANIFCPTCAPIDEQAVVLASGAGAGAGAMQVGEVRSKLPLRLLATMESDDPLWSMATIQDLETHRLGPFSTNEAIRPGVTVLAVERGRVILLNQGQREFISVGVEPPPAPSPSAAKPAPAAAAKPSGRPSVAIDGADSAIDCSNENACTVDRAFVDKLMANPTQLMTQARMVPVTKDGETAGFRVSAIRDGSLATMLGLKNGDVVSEINGSKLGNIDDALAMYQKLRRASHLSVTVERGGAVINKEISIK